MHINSLYQYSRYLFGALRKGTPAAELEEGQGTLEYIAILAAVAIVVGIIIAIGVAAAAKGGSILDWFG